MSGGEAIGAVSLSTAFDLLSDPRRRFALYCLHMSDRDTAALENLIAAVERIDDRIDADGGDSEYSDVGFALWHVHLPKLVEAGVVDVDRRTETVRYHEDPTLTEWLEHAAYTELPSSHPLVRSGSWPSD